jgi:2-keto-3-deoxy-L-rhamnonate aldolase RhmA
MLKLMYITNRPEVAAIAENAGVERIFVDMEYIGKSERQCGMDTVQCRHTIEDIRAIRACVKKADVMVRCNPIHEETENYCSSKQEIDEAVKAGADIIMLPYFKTVDEVQTFIRLVGGRTKTLLLFETPEAVEVVDEILALDGIDEVFVGLNDLSLGYKKKFMFELLADGTVERLCNTFKRKGIPYGFGGIASLGKGLLPSERVITEHYRLGSTCAILSRSFCNVQLIDDVEEIRAIFHKGLCDIRNFERECAERLAANGANYFTENTVLVKKGVAKIVESIGTK